MRWCSIPAFLVGGEGWVLSSRDRLLNPVSQKGGVVRSFLSFLEFLVAACKGGLLRSVVLRLVSLFPRFLPL